MTFTTDQIEALSAPLMADKVSQRSQGGRKLSYIEGWHAIAEANRIFGFDGWDRCTTEMKCVAERERAIGENKNPGWGVSYIARVMVTVTTPEGERITREGCGAGHGIDRDLGLAHESALKEAETDAMKRALMTFGNPFGLALYDKTQENVERAEPKKAQPKPAAKKASDFDPAMSAQRTMEILGRLEKITELARVKSYAGEVEETHSSLVPEDQKRVSDAFRERMAFLKAAATMV